MHIIDDNIVFFFFFFSSRRRHTRLQGDWSSDVCSSDLVPADVQVMFWDAPTAQTSPPTGAVRASEPLMLKAAETAETVASVGCFTRTLTVLAMASATVHE